METAIEFGTPAFWLALAQIIWVNILLSGDNAVVIALASRSLPDKQRNMAVLGGSAAAIILRIVFCLVIVWLLAIPFLKLVGGLLLVWIAWGMWKELREGDEEGGDEAGEASGEATHQPHDKHGKTLAMAMRQIIIADVSMSLDNVLAVAGASRGHFGLLLFGLAVSIPLVVFASNLISRLMARFQVLVFIGAAILGKVSGEMILSDPVVAGVLQPWWRNLTGASDAASAYGRLQLGVELVCFAAIFLLGWLRRRPAAGPAA